MSALGTSRRARRSSQRRPRDRGALFKGVLLFSLLIGFVTLIVLLIDVASDGLGKLSWDFITSFPSSLPEPRRDPVADRRHDLPDGPGRADHDPDRGRRGALPRGVRGQERWYNRAIEVNIQNLAAVPSIVYGILGLAFLVRGPIGLGRVLLAGALTLSLLVLPIVIIASREAIRAVPAVDPRGRARARRDALADDLAPGAAGRDPRHRDRLDPGAVARDRRDGAADPDRRDRVRAVQPRRPRQTSSRRCRSRSSTGPPGRRRSSSCWPPRRSSCCWRSC